jgi:hypothetical protein
MGGCVKTKTLIAFNKSREFLLSKKKRQPRPIVMPQNVIRFVWFKRNKNSSSSFLFIYLFILRRKGPN